MLMLIYDTGRGHAKKKFCWVSCSEKASGAATTFNAKTCSANKSDRVSLQLNSSNYCDSRI